MRTLIKILIIIIILFGAVLLLFSGGSLNSTKLEVEGNVVYMSGTINSDTPRQIMKLFEDNPNINTIVMKEVPGSTDDEANLKIAKFVADKNITTKIDRYGYIASGGTDFFLAGDTRIVEEGARIGVHSWATNTGEEAKDFPRGHEEHQRYIDYYKSIGFTQKEAEDFYYFTINAAPADDIYILESNEILQFGISTTGITDPVNINPEKELERKEKGLDYIDANKPKEKKKDRAKNPNKNINRGLDEQVPQAELDAFEREIEALTGGLDRDFEEIIKEIDRLTEAGDYNHEALFFEDFDSFLIGEEGEFGGPTPGNDERTTIRMEGNTIYLNGALTSDTPKQVMDTFNKNPNINMIIMEDVPGSIDDVANLRTARFIASKNVTMKIGRYGFIASGGTDLFLAGKTRIVEEGARIGVHSWSTNRNEKATDFPRGHQEHQRYIDYYKAIGFTQKESEDFYYFTINSADPNDIHIMTDAEIGKYKLTTTGISKPSFVILSMEAKRKQEGLSEITEADARRRGIEIKTQ